MRSKCEYLNISGLASSTKEPEVVDALRIPVFRGVDARTLGVDGDLLSKTDTKLQCSRLRVATGFVSYLTILLKAKR